MRTRLASVNVQSGRIGVNPCLRGEYRRRVLVHQRTYLERIRVGDSRTEAIRKARRAEHRGMSKRQVQQYEGKLGHIAKHH